MVAYKRRQLTTHERGLGRAHRHARERLLRLLDDDNRTCWWCGRPMYAEKELNWDGLALHADHSRARSLHGTYGNPPDRLLHGTCNMQRGDGSRDHLRPAARFEASTAGGGDHAAFSWG